MDKEMENKKYFEDCEEIGNKLFTKWANQTKYFKKMERQPLLSRVDWVCESNIGTIVNCELKVRNTLNYPSIFIEPGKWNYLINDWNRNKRIPLFINLCNDEVLVFDLRKVKPTREVEVMIWDGANKCQKMVTRYELETSKAVKFINGKIVK